LVGGLLISQSGWRAAFVIFGIIGLVLLIVFRLTVREPRQAHTPHSTQALGIPSLPVSVMILFHSRDYRRLCLGAGFAVFSTFGLLAWILDLFVRTHSQSLEEVSIRFALIYGLGGALGMLASAAVITILMDKHQHANLIVPGIALLISAPLAASALWIPDPTAAYICLALSIMFIHCYFGPTYALAQTLAPPELRSQASAIVVLVQVFIGAGLGPLIVGSISDVLNPLIGAGDALRVAVSVLPVSLLIAGFMFLGIARIRVEEEKS